LYLSHIDKLDRRSLGALDWAGGQRDFTSSRQCQKLTCNKPNRTGPPEQACHNQNNDREFPLPESRRHFLKHDRIQKLPNVFRSWERRLRIHISPPFALSFTPGICPSGSCSLFGFECSFVLMLTLSTWRRLTSSCVNCIKIAVSLAHDVQGAGVTAKLGALWAARKLVGLIGRTVFTYTSAAFTGLDGLVADLSCIGGNLVCFHNLGGEVGGCIPPSQTSVGLNFLPISAFRY
jgi:hypothetical protein